jgi:hypothetical protein
MGTRDKFTLPLECLVCGTTGMAYCSDTQFTLGRDPQFKVERIVGDFRAEKVIWKPTEVQFICTHCGVKAKG